MHYFPDCSYICTVMFSAQNCLSTNVEKCFKHCIPNKCMKVAKKKDMTIFVNKLAKSFATNMYQVIKNMSYLQPVVVSCAPFGIVFGNYFQIWKVPLYSFFLNINYIYIILYFCFLLWRILYIFFICNNLLSVLTNI